jgi:hypothetical protein
MSQQLSDIDINNYLNQINHMERIIKEYSSHIQLAQNNINNIKIIMKNKCNHTPTIDHSAMNEHTEYYCSRCMSSL